MRSMAERAADSQGMLYPGATLDLLVTLASLGTRALQDTPVSQVDAEFRGLRLSRDKAALRDQPLGDWVRQGLQEHEFPIADRDSQPVGLCIAQPSGIVPDVGTGTAAADADHGSPVGMDMVIRDGVGTRITPL